MSKVTPFPVIEKILISLHNDVNRLYAFDPEDVAVKCIEYDGGEALRAYDAIDRIIGMLEDIQDDILPAHQALEFRDDILRKGKL